MDINKEIAEHTTQVEAIITKYLPKESGYQKTVMEAMNYSFLAGGKAAAANADAGDLQAVWRKL